METGFANDPHSERGHFCPKNVFGYTDYRILQPIEAIFAEKRALWLEDQDITGKFDVTHLQGIHRYLFQDTFPWAGEFRVVNISKGNSMFGPALHIVGALTELLGKLAREERLRNSGQQTFVARVAFYLGEINAIHPFREGNGRTQREFIRQLAVQAGHPLSWGGFKQQEMLHASILSHTKGDNSELAAILEAALLSTRGLTL